MKHILASVMIFLGGANLLATGQSPVFIPVNTAERGAPYNMDTQNISYQISQDHDDIGLDPDSRAAIASFVSELVQCATYFGLVSSGESNHENADEIFGGYAELASNTFSTAQSWAHIIDMKGETLLAIAAFQSTQMSNKIDGDAINIGILINEYGVRCNSIVYSPLERLEYWLEIESK